MTLRTRSGRRASQSEYELSSLIALFAETKVRSYLEIGARHGDTFYDVMRSLPVGSKGVAVDLPGGNWGKDSSRHALKECCEDLCSQGYECSYLFGDSKTAATIRLVVGRGPYDAILIDGDHTYEGVSADWQNYRNLAPIVAFHDIDGEGQRSNDAKSLLVEVPRLWREIREGRRHVEFIEANNPRPMGIGVVWP